MQRDGGYLVPDRAAARQCPAAVAEESVRIGERVHPQRVGVGNARGAQAGDAVAGEIKLVAVRRPAGPEEGSRAWQRRERPLPPRPSRLRKNPFPRNSNSSLATPKTIAPTSARSSFVCSPTSIRIPPMHCGFGVSSSTCRNSLMPSDVSPVSPWLPSRAAACGNQATRFDPIHHPLVARGPT